MNPYEDSTKQPDPAPCSTGSGGHTLMKVAGKTTGSGSGGKTMIRIANRPGRDAQVPAAPVLSPPHLRHHLCPHLPTACVA